MKHILLLILLSSNFLFGQTLEEFQKMLGQPVLFDKAYISFEAQLGDCEVDLDAIPITECILIKELK